MRCCRRYVLAVAWRGLVLAAAAVGPWPECVVAACLCLCCGLSGEPFQSDAFAITGGDLTVVTQCMIKLSPRSLNHWHSNSRGRLSILLQSRRRPFTVIPMFYNRLQWNGQLGVPRPSHFGVLFLRRCLITLCTQLRVAGSPATATFLCSLHRCLTESIYVARHQ